MNRVTHHIAVTELQNELLATCLFFASQHSYGYVLSQENNHFAQQLHFSTYSEAIR